MRTLINVFRLSKSLVSNALVILTEDVNNAAPQTIDKLDAFIKLNSLFASTLQLKPNQINKVNWTNGKELFSF